MNSCPAGIPATFCKPRLTRTASGSSTPKAAALLDRESSGAPGERCRPKFVAKSWTSFWQPKLNVAWLPPEKVFLRVIELPKSSFDETLAMVELQLEKLSPIPVTQIVWTLQILPQLRRKICRPSSSSSPNAEWWKNFSANSKAQGYLADRLEAPMLDQLEADARDRRRRVDLSVAVGGQSAALVAWWFGGALRNLSFFMLPPDGDRAKNLKKQFAQFVWAGEIEGWLTAQPQWHLVADGVTGRRMGNTFARSLERTGANRRSRCRLQELAARTARRAAAANERASPVARRIFRALPRAVR